MLDIPDLGSKVRVWPHPQRRVTDGPAPFAGVHAFQNFLPPEGRDVFWTKYHLEQLRCGDLFLHDPRPQAAASKEE